MYFRTSFTFEGVSNVKYFRTFEGLASKAKYNVVRRYLRRYLRSYYYDGTEVRKYFRTSILSYGSTFVLPYFRTEVALLPYFRNSGNSRV